MDRTTGSGSSPITFTTRAADPAVVARTERLSRVRGLLLGLVLGDALSRAEQPTGPLRGTSTGQLACFTAEGLIRASVRDDHKGICHPPSVVWHAYRRWARVQGIEIGDRIGMSGWLHRVPALAERRGDAPAVVAALTAASNPTPAPATARGHHALTRILPLAMVPGSALPPAALDRMARELAEATHGHPDAIDAAATGVRLAGAALTADSLDEAVRAVDVEQLAAALDPAAALAGLAPTHSAGSALRGGVHLAARCTEPAPDRIAGTLRAAREAAAPDAVGPVAGALLGALHGVEALPVELLARLELGWVADTLARDLVAQFADHPGGQEYVEATDRHWWDRYPGS